jgi:hypothetical protein
VVDWVLHRLKPGLSSAARIAQAAARRCTGPSIAEPSTDSEQFHGLANPRLPPTDWAPVPPLLAYTLRTLGSFLPSSSNTSPRNDLAGVRLASLLRVALFRLRRANGAPRAPPPASPGAIRQLPRPVSPQRRLPSHPSGLPGPAYTRKSRIAPLLGRVCCGTASSSEGRKSSHHGPATRETTAVPAGTLSDCGTLRKAKLNRSRGAVHRGASHTVAHPPSWP